MEFEARIVTTNYHDGKPVSIDGWTEIYSKVGVKRHVIQQAYMRMNEVVHDALYDAVNCSITCCDNKFTIQSHSFSMPAYTIAHNGKFVYTIQSQLICHIDDNHIEYRDHVITICDDNKTYHITRKANAFYVKSYTINNADENSIELILNQIYYFIDLVSYNMEV